MKIETVELVEILPTKIWSEKDTFGTVHIKMQHQGMDEFDFIQYIIKNRHIREWNIQPESQMYWDIEDEQICKSILIDENNIIRLKEKHGEEYIIKTINYYKNLGIKF